VLVDDKIMRDGQTLPGSFTPAAPWRSRKSQSYENMVEKLQGFPSMDEK